ncbi:MULTISPECIES: carbohydrate-binding protein [Microbacterium]|uniref:carbohydrate-binding protein n=1 Tax=Microbacterium TaxID=33882 RepID=UPI001469A61D|nr:MULTISPECIES: carbohydrate-binding protein [Microbacterium]
MTPTGSRKRLSAVCAGGVIALLVPLIIGVGPASAAEAQHTLWVDVSGGDDANTGSESSPLRSIEAARDRVRDLNDAMTGDIVVNIRPGDYYLDDTLTFGVEDSGSNGHDVIYRAAGTKGSVHVIGGEKIAGAWTKAETSDVNAKLPEASKAHVFKKQLPVGTDFNTLYVDGTRAITARTKNYEHDERFPAADGTSDDNFLITAAGGQYNIVYGNDLAQSAIDGLAYSQAQGHLNAQFVIWSGYATGGSDWYQETVPIGAINPANKNITAVKDPAKIELNRTHWTHGPGYRYFLQNDLSFLDSPGEYYFNPTTRMLYYYPESSQVSGDTLKAEVVYPTMQKAINFKGNAKTDLAAAPSASAQVRNIVLDGLTVEMTDFADSYLFAWNAYDAYGMQKFPDEAAGSSNPSYSENTDRIEYHVGAITMTDANHITIENSRITNVGMNAIELFRDNDSITIRNSRIDNTGMGGINIDGGYPGIGAFNGNHVITNNLIHDVGQLVGHQPGVTLMSTGHNKLSHLEIFNAPRRGILLNAGWIRNTADTGFNPLEDMYTVDNDFSYIYVHHTQQDAGEDSAIFGWILLHRDRVMQLTGTDRVAENKYNRFEQIIIDSPGANPSMHDKNTVLGMDFAMRATGLRFTDVKATNSQSFTISARPWHDLDNVNYNLMNENEDWTGVDTFDDSRMEYDKIGLKDDFPAEFALGTVEEEEYDDVYFEEDFEGASIDLTDKWIAERGTPEQSTIYMSEGPFDGKKSLSIDPIDNPEGTLLSRTFGTQLNKVVTMKYFDKRNDRAYSDKEKPNLPNSFGRADDGVTQRAIGADGRVSTDFFLVKDGDTTTITDVPRAFGWHEFTWDYTSGTEVVMSIDGTIVATLPATSFDFVSMGDPTGEGGRAYFDELVIHGGDPAPAPGDVVQPMVVDGTLDATNFDTQSGLTISTAPAPENGTMAGYIDQGDYLEYFVNVKKTGTYKVDYRVAVNPGYVGNVDVVVDGVTKASASFPSTGGWQSWADLTDSVPLTAGLHTIRLKATSNGWNFKSAAFTYGGKSVPGRIQAEAHDAAAGIQKGSGPSGPIVGYIDANDTMDYSVYADAPGVYRVDYRVAVNAGYVGGVELQANGTPVKTTALPSTGGWQSWATVTDYVTLPGGPQTLRLKATANGWNFDWVEFTYAGRHAVPGVIAAEQFDKMSGIQVSNSAAGGQHVGYIDADDWIEYDIHVAKTSNYAIDYKAAVHAGYAGGVELLVDGVSKVTTSLASTGGWENWATVTAPQVVPLAEGRHTLRLKATSNGWNLDAVTLRDVGRAVPGTFEAESFDGMSGIQVGSSVATEGDGAKHVGYIEANDWMEYQLYVPQAATYTVKYRVAVNSGYTGGVDFLVDGASHKVTSLPTTGGWQSWQTVTDTVSLPAGQHTIRLKATASGWNFNWFEIAAP